MEDPWSYNSIFRVLHSRSWRDLFTLDSNQNRPFSPHKQVDFQNEIPTVSLPTFFSRDIEDRFSAKKNAGAVYIDLIAANDTVWHGSLKYKTNSICSRQTHDEPFHGDFSNRSFNFTNDLGLVSRVLRL